MEMFLVGNCNLFSGPNTLKVHNSPPVILNKTSTWKVPYSPLRYCIMSQIMFHYKKNIDIYFSLTWLSCQRYFIFKINKHHDINNFTLTSTPFDYAILVYIVTENYCLQILIYSLMKMILYPCNHHTCIPVQE